MVFYDHLKSNADQNIVTTGNRMTIIERAAF